MIIKKIITTNYFKSIYSRSLRLGFLEGSFDKNPKKNNETKKITLVYTKIFKVNIIYILNINIFLYCRLKQVE